MADMKNSEDSLHHFLFENTLSEGVISESKSNAPMPIRGNLVHLNQTFRHAMQHQYIPKMLKIALGELMAASALLSATLKMEGALVLQLQSKGALKLLVVECSQDLEWGLHLRATAKWDETLTEEIENSNFVDLVKHGQFVITLDPNIGEAYQGIVPIEGETIAQMLQNYMLRSQQIDTSLWLHCDGESASGMLLQKLPNIGELDADAWNRVNILADTVTNDELKSLPAETLLTRLFAEEDIRLFEAKTTQFRCSCSKTKVGNMLRLLGADEVNSILAEQAKIQGVTQAVIQVNCDFCNKLYLFDAVDAAQILASSDAIAPSVAKH
jgi:molecular chaperone Hsp33